MSTSPRFEIEPATYEPQEEKPKSCLRSCLTGCLIALVVLVVLGVIAGIWISRNWRDWAASFGGTALKEAIAQSDLDPLEKDQVAGQVDRVADAFREGRITDDQMELLFEKLFDSPLMTALAASAAEKKYIDGSGLDEDEKTEARQTLRRFFRGTIDGDIDREGMDSALAHVADDQGDGNWKLRERVTDHELRAFLKEAKSAADEAEVPAEPEDIDPSDELERIINEATGLDAAAKPQPEGAPDEDAEPPFGEDAPLGVGDGDQP